MLAQPLVKILPCQHQAQYGFGVCDIAAVDLLERLAVINPVYLDDLVCMPVGIGGMQIASEIKMDFLVTETRGGNNAAE